MNEDTDKWQLTTPPFLVPTVGPTNDKDSSRRPMMLRSSSLGLDELPPIPPRGHTHNSHHQRTTTDKKTNNTIDKKSSSSQNNHRQEGHPKHSQHDFVDRKEVSMENSSLEETIAGKNSPHKKHKHHHHIVVDDAKINHPNKQGTKKVTQSSHKYHRSHHHHNKAEKSNQKEKGEGTIHHNNNNNATLISDPTAVILHKAKHTPKKEGKFTNHKQRKHRKPHAQTKKTERHAPLHDQDDRKRYRKPKKKVEAPIIPEDTKELTTSLHKTSPTNLTDKEILDGKDKGKKKERINHHVLKKKERKQKRAVLPARSPKGEKTDSAQREEQEEHQSTYPEEVPWLLENEFVGKNPLKKTEVDEMIAAKKKVTQEEPKSDRRNSPDKEDKGPQLIFLVEGDEEEGDVPYNPPWNSNKVGNHKNRKLQVPKLITIDDDENDNSEEGVIVNIVTPTTNVRPGAFAVDGPQMTTRPHDEERLANNNAVNASAFIVPEVPEAILVDENEKIRRKTFRRRLLLFLSVILLTVGAIIGWQVTPGSGNNNDNVQPMTLSPTENPNPTRELLSSISPNSIPALNNESSPQYKALKWLVADEDGNNTDENNTKNESSFLSSYSEIQIVQRWVLATLYYSTGGEDWTESSQWLSDDHECLWNTSMVHCDDVDGRQEYVTHLNLTANNLFGTIPLEVGLLSDSLTHILFRRNSLGGTMPSELGTLTRLEWLDLTYNNLVGIIPTELGLLTNAYKFLLGENTLTGTIPKEFGGMDSQRLHTVELFYNQLTGTIPSEISLNSQSLIYLTLQSNLLNGTIPTEIGLLTNSDGILLGYNKLSGTLPTEVGLLSNLVAMFSIQENPLIGTLPSEIGLLTSTQYIFLHNTAMSPGTIPTEIGHLQSVKMLTIDGNSIIGTIPSQIGLLSQLQLLSMSENYLDGPIPSEIGLLSNTLQGINIADNKLTGPIPSTFGQLTGLMWLYIYENDLIDPIPESVCALRDVGTGVLEKFDADCDEIKCPSTCCTYCTY